MSKVLTIMLAGGTGERLYPLTKDCAKPAVPFAGAYRIIDVTLSNCISAVRGKLRQRTVSLYRSMSYGLFCPGTI